MSGCGHETDMPTLPPDVCFRGQIGHAVQAVQLPANDLGPRPEPDFGRFQRGANSRESRPPTAFHNGRNVAPCMPRSVIPL